MLMERSQQATTLREEVAAFGGEVTFATILCGKKSGNIVPVHNRILVFNEIVHDVENYPGVARYGTMVQTKYLHRKMQWQPQDAKPGDVPALIHVYQYEFSSEPKAAGAFQEMFLLGRIVMYDGEGTLKPYEEPKAEEEKKGGEDAAANEPA